MLIKNAMLIPAPFVQVLLSLWPAWLSG